MGPVHEYTLTIREHHLDTFGHVNNATYLELFEEARWEWITQGGYGLREIAQRRQGPTMLECTLRFRRELRNRQPVRIRSWVEEYVGKVASVRQDLFADEVQPSCSATMLMGLFDVEARKLIEPSPAWLACLGLDPSDWQPKR